MKHKKVDISDIPGSNIEEMNLRKVMFNGMKIYSLYTVSERAIGYSTDGLKPVYRRLLYSAHNLGMTPGSHYRKSALLCGDTMGKYHPHGDCLSGDTLIPLFNGEVVPIKELVKIGKEQKVISYDEKTKSYKMAIAKAWRIGQKTNIKYIITLSNNEKIECTSNHPFYVNNTWVKTENIKVGDIFIGGDVKSLKDFNFDKNDEIEVIKIDKIILKEPEDFYDFTVDDYHNIVIKLNEKFVIAHNSGLYGALVTLTQDFSTRYPLFDGQGNWGSVFGASPAASRYTETRLTKMGNEFFKDIKYVQKVPNYDGTTHEPLTLPAPLPIALLNGYSGIATGIAGSIPSHNIVDVCNTAISLIKDPEISIKKLAHILKGPDLPTGMILTNPEDLLELYQTGKGTLKFNAVYHYENDEKKGIYKLVLDSIPFGMTLDSKKADDNWINKLKVQIALGEKDKNGNPIKGGKDKITFLDESSSKTGIRVVFSCDDPRKLRDRIEPFFKNFSQSYQFYLLDKVKIEEDENISANVRMYNLKELLESWYEFRKEIVTKRIKDFIEKTTWEKLKVEARLAIVNYGNPKKLGEIFTSDTEETARQLLMSTLKINEKQADYLLGCLLRSLLKLNKKSLDNENQKYIDDLKKYKEQLNDIPGVIISELEYYKKEFKDERRTIIKGGDEEITPEFTGIEDTDQFVSILDKGVIFHIDANSSRKKLRANENSPLVCMSKKHIGIFYDTGVFETYNSYNIPDIASGKGLPLCIVNENSKYLISVLQNGKISFIENKKQEKDIQRVARKSILGFGCSDNDLIALKYKDGFVFIYGKDLIAKESLKVQNQIPTKIYVIKPKSILYTNKREEANISTSLISKNELKLIQSWQFAKMRLYSVSKESNLIIDKNGDIKIVSRQEVLNELNTIKACIAL